MKKETFPLKREDELKDQQKAIERAQLRVSGKSPKEIEELFKLKETLESATEQAGELEQILKKPEYKQFSEIEHHDEEFEKRYEMLLKEFDRQTKNLIKKDYPKLVKMDKDEFLSRIESLKKELKKLAESKFEKGHIPFLIMINSEAIRIMRTMNDEPVEINKPVYLITDIDIQKAKAGDLNKELEKFKKEKRLPLTVSEGIILADQYPEIFQESYYPVFFLASASKQNKGYFAAIDNKVGGGVGARDEVLDTYFGRGHGREAFMYSERVASCESRI